MQEAGIDLRQIRIFDFKTGQEPFIAAEIEDARDRRAGAVGAHQIARREIELRQQNRVVLPQRRLEFSSGDDSERRRVAHRWQASG